MKQLFTSTLLTLAAVPFLMAAPHAAKKVQNTSASATTQNKTAVKKAHKKHVKKSQTNSKPVADAATSSKK